MLPKTFDVDAETDLAFAECTWFRHNAALHMTAIRAFAFSLIQTADLGKKQYTKVGGVSTR